MDFGEVKIGMTAAPKRAGAPCEQCIISSPATRYPTPTPLSVGKGKRRART